MVSKPFDLEVFVIKSAQAVTPSRQNVVKPSTPAEIKYYDKDMMKNPLSLKRTHAPVPANMCVFKLTNLMLVMLKKLKLSLKSLKIKSSRKTKKN